MEKRLSLTIDPSNAKKGSNDLLKVLGELEKKAKNISKALGDLSTAEKFLQVTKKTSESTGKAAKSTDDYASALSKAEKAIQSNYHTVKLLNGEVGKELELSKKMVANKKLEFEATSKEAQAVNAATTKTKAYLKIQNDLLKTKEKLALVNTKEYKELVNLRKELDSAEKSAKGLDNQSRQLQRTMMGVGIAASMFSGTQIAQEMIRVLDSYTELQNKLAVVTGSTRGLTLQTRELLEVAIESRSSLEATVDLYSKLNRVGQEYNLTQKQVRTITETVTKAVAMSGATASASQGAIIQFAQALSNNFQAAGQELNSINEQTPALAQAIAQAITATGKLGVVAQTDLKRLGKEGKLSTELILEGLQMITTTVDDKFNTSLKTVSQSWQGLTDSLTIAAGEFDKTVGVSRELVGVLDDLTGSLNENKELVLGLAGALSGTALAAGVGTVAALVALMGAPLALGLAAIVALPAAAAAITVKFYEANIEAAAFVENLQEIETVQNRLKTLNTNFNILSMDAVMNENAAAISNVTEGIKALESEVDNRFLKEYLTFEGKSTEERLINVGKALEIVNNNLKYGVGVDETTGNQLKTLLENYKELLGVEVELNEKFKEGFSGKPASDAEDMAEALVNLEGIISKLGTSWEELRKGMKNTIEDFSRTSLEIEVNNARLRAAKAVQSDYDKVLKDKKLTDQERVALEKQLAKAMEDAQNEAERLATETYRLNQEEKKRAKNLADEIALQKRLTEARKKAEQDIKNSYGSLTRPAGIFGDVQDIEGQIRDWERTGAVVTQEHKALMYMNTFEGVSTGIADALESGDVSNLVQSFGNLLGSAVSQSVGQGITASLAQSGMSAMGAGLLGAVGGGIAGGLIGAALKPRKTTQTGTGYNIGISGGSITNAATSQSFRRSGNLFSSSSSWTEYQNLSNTALESLGNSFSLANATLASQAEAMGINLKDFTGVLETKDGSLADSIDQFTNKSADAAFAAIEKYQYLGESMYETFTRLAEQADMITEGFKTTGMSLASVERQFVNSTSTSLANSYQSQINSTLAQIEQGRIDAENSVSEYYYWSGGNLAGNRQLKSRRRYERDVREAIENATSNLYADLRELYQRLANVNTEASQQFKDSLLNTIAELNDVSVDDAASKFQELTSSFLENYYSTEEQLQIAANNAAADLASMNISGIDLSTTSQELRTLYENASSPERIAEILSAAKALADYNTAMDELSGGVGNFVGSFSDALTEAFEKLVAEIDDLAGSVDNATRLMQRQRAEQTLQAALAEAQTTGTVAVTEELRNALSIIQKPSEELYSDYASYMRSLGTSANIIDQLRDYGSVPQFATGGYHSGGIRLVGEQQPELEVTGASRIFSAQETRNMFDIRPLVQELASLRSELRVTQMQLVKNSSKSNSDLSRIREDINRIRQIDEGNLYA